VGLRYEELENRGGELVRETLRPIKNGSLGSKARNVLKDQGDSLNFKDRLRHHGGKKHEVKGTKKLGEME